MTMFGRDSIFTSLQALPFTPELAAFQKACGKNHARACFTYASVIRIPEEGSAKQEKLALTARKKGLQLMEQRCTKNKIAAACEWAANFYGGVSWAEAGSEEGGSAAPAGVQDPHGRGMPTARSSAGTAGGLSLHKARRSAEDEAGDEAGDEASGANTGRQRADDAGRAGEGTGADEQFSTRRCRRSLLTSVRDAVIDETRRADERGHRQHGAAVDV